MAHTLTKENRIQIDNLPTNALVVAKNLSIRPKQSIVSMKLVSNLWELSILPCFHQFSVELSSTWVCLNIQYWFPPVIWQSRGFTAFPMSDTFENMNPIAHKEIYGFYGRRKTMSKKWFQYLAWNLVTLVKTLSCGSIEDLPTAQQLMLWHLHRNVVKVPVQKIYLYKYRARQRFPSKVRTGQQAKPTHHWNDLHWSLSLRALLSDTSPKCPTLSESSLSQRP